jgi:pimeloyl-ACP methyl ester carboxylesterase
MDADLAVALTTKDRITRLSVPGICLYGQDDVILPVHLGQEQEDVLPDIQFFYPEDCGHQGQTDQPELFNQVFLEFFRDGRISRKTADWAGVSTRRPENPALVEQVTGER